MSAPAAPAGRERIAVIGMGYVGLPLAVALARSGADMLGFDISAEHVAVLSTGTDPNGEVSDDEMAAAGLAFSADPAALSGRTTFIIAVPTPVTEAKVPDLGPLRAACAAIGPHLAPGALVVLESTVYPGVTEEICGPALATASGLAPGRDFHLGYSPERMNPGDAAHSLGKVVKVISAESAPVLERVAAIYAPIAGAGLYRAASIRTAEAAKIIENTQRDINIALINEFALIFARLGLDTKEVIDTAATKWNFLPFRPGLVGGHCIGVDPYYITHCAEAVGYHPEVILAGRRINDRMGTHIAQEMVKALLQREIDPGSARVLVLGFTFKENCADIRNTRVADIVRELQACTVQTDVYDPRASAAAIGREYGIAALDSLPAGPYHAVIVAVAHDEFRQLGAAGVRALCTANGLVFDVKGIFERADAELRL